MIEKGVKEKPEKRENGKCCCCAVSTLFVIVALGVVGFVFRHEINDEVQKWQNNGSLNDKNSTEVRCDFDDIDKLNETAWPESSTISEKMPDYIYEDGEGTDSDEEPEETTSRASEIIDTTMDTTELIIDDTTDDLEISREETTPETRDNGTSDDIETSGDETTTETFNIDGNNQNLLDNDSSESAESKEDAFVDSSPNLLNDTLDGSEEDDDAEWITTTTVQSEVFTSSENVVEETTKSKITLADSDDEDYYGTYDDEIGSGDRAEE